MNAYLSRLNPVERRFVIGVGLLFFLVINIFWIWPHFSDYKIWRKRLATARQSFSTNSIAISAIPALQRELGQLASEGDVPTEDQSLRFLQTIQAQAYQSGVSFNFPSRLTETTNAYFIEKGQTVSIQGGEKELVDFLYNIGAGDSLIRARALNLRPEANHYRLNANITFVASYQKKHIAPARTAPAGPASKGAVTPTPARKSTPGQLPAVKQGTLPQPKTPAPLPAQIRRSAGTNAPNLPRKK